MEINDFAYHYDSKQAAFAKINALLVSNDIFIFPLKVMSWFIHEMWHLQRIKHRCCTIYVTIYHRIYQLSMSQGLLTMPESDC